MKVSKNETPSASGRFQSAKTLLFDADDTLWENNIYFEQAIAAFISYLDHRIHTPEEVREHLNTVERATIAAYADGEADPLYYLRDELNARQMSIQELGRTS